MRADTRTQIPSRRRVICLGCLRELLRAPEMDPAVPLQYCDRAICQELSREHDAQLEAHGSSAG